MQIRLISQIWQNNASQFLIQAWQKALKGKIWAKRLYDYILISVYKKKNMKPHTVP